MLHHTKTLIVRPCPGLGDAIYAYPVVKHLMKRYKACKFLVATKHKEVFEYLHGDRLGFTDQSDHFDIDCTYLDRKLEKTNQFQDVCIKAGIKEEIPFSIDLVNRQIVPPSEKKTVLIRNPYLGMELRKTDLMMPNIRLLASKFTSDKNFRTVLLTHERDMTCKLDLDFDFVFESRSVCETLNLVRQSDIVVTQVGNLLAAAEAMDKPTIAVFSRKMRDSQNVFLSSITPEKVVTKITTEFFYDDDPRMEN
jgi:ADP-heptose:LPS heptosyltransferase